MSGSLPGNRKACKKVVIFHRPSSPSNTSANPSRLALQAGLRMPKLVIELVTTPADKLATLETRLRPGLAQAGRRVAAHHSHQGEEQHHGLKQASGGIVTCASISFDILRHWLPRCAGERKPRSAKRMVTFAVFTAC